MYYRYSWTGVVCEEVARDFSLGGGLRRALKFPQPLTTSKSWHSYSSADKSDDETKLQK